MIRLVEYFWTYQGEGQNWGKRALFVRVPFCNLSCSWCDTQFNTFEKVEEEALEKYACSESSKFAVITGGEPSMSKETPKVIQLLKRYGFTLAMETNGNFPIPEGIDFVTVSPKEDADFLICEDAFKKASEFKYVVDSKFQIDCISEEVLESDRTILLSPEFNELEKNLKKIEEIIKKTGRFRLSLQTHKFIGVR